MICAYYHLHGLVSGVDTRKYYDQTVQRPADLFIELQIVMGTSFQQGLYTLKAGRPADPPSGGLIKGSSQDLFYS